MSDAPSSQGSAKTVYIAFAPKLWVAIQASCPSLPFAVQAMPRFLHCIDHRYNSDNASECIRHALGACLLVSPPSIPHPSLEPFQARNVVEPENFRYLRGFSMQNVPFVPMWSHPFSAMGVAPRFTPRAIRANS